VQVGDEVIQPSAAARDLGVHLDSELSMKRHVGMVAASCFYHLRRLRQMGRRRAGEEVTTQLVITYFTSRLDYCDSVLARLPQATLEPLQRVQNAAVCLVLELNTRNHMNPGLFQFVIVSSSSCVLSCTPPDVLRTRWTVSDP